MMQDQGLIGFAQTRIRTQGYSPQEAAVANAVVAEMQRLHFDERYIDDCGNAVGIVKGKKPGKRLLKDGHIDTCVAEA